MEVHFSSEQDAQLSQMAIHAGTSKEQLVKDAVARLMDDTAKFRTALGEGIAQANSSELVDDDDVRLWLEQKESS